MQIVEKTTTLTTKIIEDPQEILEKLNKGISIPILPEFKKYILKELKAYDAKAILLEEEFEQKLFGELTDNTAGITLVYGDGSDTLFFGFFGVYDHSPDRISSLMDALIQYGDDNGYKTIRGPINIPTYIFGWGFMVEGSRKNVFIGSPINPPIYQDVFIRSGFEILFQEDRYDMAAMKMDPHTLPKLIDLGINNGDVYKSFVEKGLKKCLRSEENLDKYIQDTGDYPYVYINPGRDGMKEVKEEWIQLNREFMPPSAQITPKADHYIDSLTEFIFEFGMDCMMWIVRHKETGDLVATGYVIPNVFSKNKKNELDSVSFHAWVVHPDHRRMYLAMIMYGFTTLKGVNRRTPHYITWGSWPVGAENEANGGAARKMGGKKDRSHLILEKHL